MIMMKIKNLVLQAGLLTALLATATVQASGVHYQISTSTRFYADNAGHLAGLRMNWVYDPEVSALITDGRPLDEAGLRHLGEDIIADLYTMGYYLQFTANGQPVPVKKVTQFTLKRVEGHRIQLGMQVELKQPMVVNGKTFTLTLVDPDSSASLRYSSADRIVLDKALAAQCAAPQLSNRQAVVNEHEIMLQTAIVRCP
ncbi:MAG: hypothetical protein CSA79_06310 [Thiothrix nivea]|nr:MAG: hypothetical protein CSA79_06310 [Thiothrix nivea]